ncbi:MAG: 6-bladed beta-propeller [Prevotellaceae bacterium]|jgi:hypothetical protein|nr:6-bladed beta-propeller [Prevotellaceae bacterium]
MRTGIITFIAIFFSLPSCGTKESQSLAGLTEVKITPDMSNQVNITTLITDIEIIPLETSDACLIKQVRRVKTDGSHWYVQDWNDAPLKVFSKEGGYITEIGSRGNGPGEFLQFSDFLIDDDHIDIFAWSGNKQWLHYSANNKFLYGTAITFPFDEIHKFDDNNYLVYVSNGTVFSEDSYNLYHIDNMFQVKSRIDGKKYPYDIKLDIAQDHFKYNAENLLYMKSYCDTIFKISSPLDITPKYHLDFGKNWYSAQFLRNNYEKSIFEIYEKIDNNHYAKWLSFLENDRHLVVGYAIKKDLEEPRHLAIYSRETGAVYNFRDSDPVVALFAYPNCLSGNAFVSIIEADKFLKIASQIKGNDAVSEKIKQYAERVIEDDNPILIKYQL